MFLGMEEDDVHFNKGDYKSIWRQLFVGGIFQLDLNQASYWVFDALDECREQTVLSTLFEKMNNSSSSIQVFASSRPNSDLSDSFEGLEPPAKIHSIALEDTMDDILSYMRKHTNHPSMRGENRETLIRTLMEKSEGCFLWVRLVLIELRKAHTSNETSKILTEVLPGMDKLYGRTLRKMSEASYGKYFAKAVLTWVVCCIRPLTTDELEAALTIQLGDTVDNLKDQISSLCSNLIYIDSQSRVKVVHQTARRFLLSQDPSSEFALDAKQSNQELAYTCLEYLISDEMKTTRNRRPSAATQPVATLHSPFAEYATGCFYEHIQRSSSADNKLMIQLFKLLSSREGYMLSWIEHVASTQDLSPLIKAGAVFKNFMQRRAKHSPALGKEAKMMDLWGVDLIHIVAKFGHNLLSFPPSIVYLIPPFCPKDSALYQLFGKSNRGIAVSGLSSTSWDDRLACLVYRSSHAVAVSCSFNTFAIAASDKFISLYRTSTCQIAGRLKHGDFIRHLEFSPSGRLLASAGRRFVAIWDVGQRVALSRFRSAHPCISMTFTADNKTLLLACTNNRHYRYGVDSGEISEEKPWYIDIHNRETISRAPDAAAFSLYHGLFASVYRGDHIYIWDWRKDEYIGTCEKPSAREEIHPFHASSIVFNPWRSTSLLAAAYEAGQIIVFDPREGDIVATYKADTDTQVLACSSDGRTLISGDALGTVRIFDFSQLKLLHVIYGHEKNIVSLAFSSDNLRFVDIRGTECNVWEPAALARHITEGDGSETNSVDMQELPLPELVEINEISAITPDMQGEFIFCGSMDGILTQVSSRHTDRQFTELYRHSKGNAILKLTFDANFRIIASADSSSRILVFQMIRQNTGWKTEHLLLDYRMDESVEQLICSPDGKRLLIVTTTTDTLCFLEDGSTRSLHWTTRNPGIWVTHPRSPSQLILTTKARMRIYEWDNLNELTAEGGVSLDAEIDEDLELRQVYPAWRGQIWLPNIPSSSETGQKATCFFGILPALSRLPVRSALIQFCSRRVSPSCRQWELLEQLSESERIESSS